MFRKYLLRIYREPGTLLGTWIQDGDMTAVEDPREREREREVLRGRYRALKQF